MTNDKFTDEELELMERLDFHRVVAKEDFISGLDTIQGSSSNQEIAKLTIKVVGEDRATEIAEAIKTETI